MNISTPIPVVAIDRLLLHVLGAFPDVDFYVETSEHAAAFTTTGFSEAAELARYLLGEIETGAFYSTFSVLVEPLRLRHSSLPYFRVVASLEPLGLHEPRKDRS